MGAGVYGQQTVIPFCCSFLLTFFLLLWQGSFSWAAVTQVRSALVWGFHELQFFREYAPALTWGLPWAAV